ncbi:MAG: hypothetical protein HKN57_12995 [Xanthomonadales bacterium]|nr:hypothetical protein [Gammaproteobacteria bacterium]NND58154.1 hypothetical protein [Xanthomonadales bacterium]NNK52525.1 hypothetical protein [Xanthomonadales bacterium]
MAEVNSKLGNIGLLVGALALLLALVHFYAGPFSPQPTIETSVAEKAVAIRDATVAALKGEVIEKKTYVSKMNLDKATYITTAVLGGLAVILGVVAFARKESTRVAVGAGLLGGLAIAFQFIGVALGIIVFAILIAVVLSQLGFG